MTDSNPASLPGQTITYDIPYTESELFYLAARRTGDVSEIEEYDFNWDTVRVQKTTNLLKRWWSAMCGSLAGWALKEYDRWGDYYMVIDEQYSANKIADMEEIRAMYE
jgi:hypothetical protein